MSRRLIIIIVIGAIALIWGLLDGPAARQRRGMAAAHALGRQLEARIAGDPRYASINFRVSTQPSLFVHGEVPDAKALDDLKAMVILPPDANYGLRFGVKIVAAPAAVPK